MATYDFSANTKANLASGQQLIAIPGYGQFTQDQFNTAWSKATDAQKAKLSQYGSFTGAGSSASPAIVSTTVTPAKTATPAPVTDPAVDTSKVTANLAEGLKNAPTLFSSRDAYDKAYNYATASDAKKKAMDAFWNSDVMKTKTAATAPVASTKADSVVDTTSKGAVANVEQVATAKAQELMDNQKAYNAKVLAALDEATAPILSKFKEQYGQYQTALDNAQKSYDSYASGVKDLLQNSNQEIDISKGGQMQAMRAQLAARGITGEAADAAVAQASYDPKYITAANNLKKSYLADMKSASDSLNNFIQSVTQSQTSLTTTENNVLEQIRTQKKELDNAIKEIGSTGISEKFKGLESYANAKLDVAAENAAKNFDIRQDAAVWAGSDADTRKATIYNSLYSSSGEDLRGLITEAELAEAAKKNTPADAKAYLMNVMQNKKATATAATTVSTVPTFGPVNRTRSDGSQITQAEIASEWNAADATGKKKIEQFFGTNAK